MPLASAAFYGVDLNGEAIQNCQLHQVRIRGFQHQVKVIAHQAVGVHLPAGLLARFRQRLDQILAVHIIDENVLPGVPALRMIDPAAAAKAGVK